MAAKSRTIDEYLAALPRDKRGALEKVRQAIRLAAPKAEECFAYGMPAFRVNKILVAGFSASAKHCSYFPMSGTITGKLQADLAEYETSKGTVRFSTDRVLPAALVRKLVRTRIAEAEAVASRRSDVASTRGSTRSRLTRG
jgi:uncharacterized protein YdhG (YjbR/CyaY superfamily)